MVIFMVDVQEFLTHLDNNPKYEYEWSELDGEEIVVVHNSEFDS